MIESILLWLADDGNRNHVSDGFAGRVRVISNCRDGTFEEHAACGGMHLRNDAQPPRGRRCKAGYLIERQGAFSHAGSQREKGIPKQVHIT